MTGYFSLFDSIDLDGRYSQWEGLPVNSEHVAYRIINNANDRELTLQVQQLEYHVSDWEHSYTVSQGPAYDLIKINWKWGHARILERSSYQEYVDYGHEGIWETRYTDNYHYLHFDNWRNLADQYVQPMMWFELPHSTK